MTTSPRWRRGDPWTLAWLIGAAVVWGLRGFQVALSRDSSFYLYAGQEVVAGNAPYEAVMNRAGPLAHLFPALGVVIGRTLGLGDVGGARAVFFLFAIMTPALVYVLVRHSTGSRVAGSAGAATMLCFQGFAAFAASGPNSKQPMVMFLLVALLLLQRRRMAAAGIATGLATLSWQPVLIALLPAALVVVALGHRGSRDRVVAAVRFGLGGAATLVVTVAGFAVAGALGAFLEGFLTANAKHTTQPGAWDAPLKAWALVVRANGWTSWVVVAGCLAALVLGGWALRRRPVHTDALALAATTVGGLMWCAIAFNGPPDVFLLLPAVSCGIGGAVGLLLHLDATRRPRAYRVLVVTSLAWVLVSLVATTHFTVTTHSRGLVPQTKAAEALFRRLPDDATVFSAEAPQPLALTGNRSVSRFVLFGNGMKSHIDATWEGGLPAYIAWLQAEAVTLVLTPNDGIRPPFQPVLRDYVLVGAAPGWVAYLHEDVDLDTRAKVVRALVRHHPDQA